MFRKTLLACALAFALMTAACSEETPSTTTAAPAAPPETTTAAAFPRDVLGVTIPGEPMRIVSASASHTEMIYALGVGDRLIATDLFSDWPPEAVETEKIDGFNIGVETVAALDPDLVILFFDPGEVVEGLGRLGIPTILFFAPATLDEAYAQIEAVGAAIGADSEGDALVAGMRADIEEITARIPTGDDLPTYYHELDPTLYSITSSTFIGSIYALAGMENIADPADEAGFGYPQLSAEYLIAANPDFIFLADTVCCGQSAATVAERPGWDTLTAVRTGRVIELDDSIASRWGPRIVEFLEMVVDAAYVTAG
jgi:iron complex transport system substrate-binding protein